MYYKYNGINLYYEKYGNEKEVIIILPGWGDTRKTFYYIIGILKNFYTIYVPDYPGFGNTKFPSYSLTIYDYTILINEWIKHLNIENPTIIGHSFGGRISIILNGYYDFPYKNIFLISSAGIKPKKTIKSRIRSISYKFLKKLADIFLRKNKESFKKKLFEHYASEDYKALPDKMKKTFQNVVNEDLTCYLSKMKGNIHLIWGSDDKSTPLSDGLKMHKLIPNSDIYIIKDAGHYVYLDNPIEVIKKIDELIETNSSETK